MGPVSHVPYLLPSPGGCELDAVVYAALPCSQSQTLDLEPFVD